MHPIVSQSKHSVDPGRVMDMAPRQGLDRLADPAAISLVPPARSRDEDFSEFFRSQYRPAVALAAALTGRRAVAEELAQEAFSRAYRHWDKIAAYDNPGAWLRRVLLNLAVSSLRRRSREARALASVWSRRDREATQPQPFDDELWLALRTLPKRQAQCLALHYLEHRSVSDIANVLAIAEPTIRVHLSRGRAALARQLGLAEEERA